MLLALCVIGIIVVLVRLVDGMSGLNLKRHDSGTIIKRGMLSQPPKAVAIFTASQYENAKEYNDAQIARRYKSLDRTVKILRVVVILLVALAIVSSFAVKTGGIN